jgi:hypothetical protein
MLLDTDGQVLDDEVVIIRPSDSAGDSKIFKPYSGVRFPRVIGYVSRWSEAR